MIIALAGRRIDAPGADPPRFPLRNVSLVEQRLRALFEAERARALVSSAACGADLLAQGVAGALGMRRRAVLPFDPERFRQTSVTDRPGNWGPLYDRLLEELRATGNVVILGGHGEGAGAYAATNLAILDHAAALAGESRGEALAVLVWEGASRGPDDLTAAFGEEARRRGLRAVAASTI